MLINIHKALAIPQLGVYKWVVDDVVKNCREDFLNEGVDVQVLEDLKQVQCALN